MMSRLQTWMRLSSASLSAGLALLLSGTTALGQINRKAGDYLMTGGSAFETFSSGNATETWLNDNGGQRISCGADGRWIPPTGKRCFVVYHHRQLRYWFPMSDAEGSRVKAKWLDHELTKLGKKPDGAEIYGYCFEQGQGLDCAALMKDGADMIAEAKKELQGGDEALDESIQELSGGLGMLKGMGDDPTNGGSSGGTAHEIGQMDDLNEKLAGIWKEGRGKVGMAAVINNLRARHLPKSMQPQDGKPGGVPDSSVEGEKNREARAGGQDQVPQPGAPDAMGIDGDGDEAKTKDGDGSKDNPGWFKVKNPFSRWFKTVWDILCTYVFPGESCAVVERWLAVAYMIMPEVFDHVVSFLGRLQDTLTPKSMDDLLNNLSDLYQEATKFLECLQSIVNLMNDPQFLQAVENFDFSKVDIGKALDLANNTSLISDETLRTIKSLVPLDGLTPGGILDASAFGKRLLNHGLDYAAKKAREIPFLGPLVNWDAAKKCALNPSAECMKTLGQDAAMRGTRKLLDESGLGEYGLAAEQLILKGDLTQAGREALLSPLNKYPECQAIARRAIEGGPSANWSEASDCVAGATGNRELAAKFRSYLDAESAARAAGKKLKEDLGRLLKDEQVPSDAVNGLLKGQTEEALTWMAKKLRLLSPEATQAFLKGGLKSALKEELSAGRTNRAMRKRQGIERWQHTMNRYEYAQLLLKARKANGRPLTKKLPTLRQQMLNSIR